MLVLCCAGVYYIYDLKNPLIGAMAVENTKFIEIAKQLSKSTSSRIYIIGKSTAEKTINYNSKDKRRLTRILEEICKANDMTFKNMPFEITSRDFIVKMKNEKDESYYIIKHGTEKYYQR